MAGGGSEPKKVSTYLLKPSLLPNGSDSYRIQTCNLLIRSQMLYSVELANQRLLSLLRLQSYNHFLNRASFFVGILREILKFVVENAAKLNESG